jgi:hypothetical protein
MEVRAVGIRTIDERSFYVVHPLDDVPEKKRKADIGPMKMTPSVKWSLLALRGYLVGMGMLVFYHVLDLAGAFQHHHFHTLAGILSRR